MNTPLLLSASFALVALSLAAPATARPPSGHDHAPEQTQEQEREVLYWYDPMYPQQQFDAPGPSPFMDMDLVPRYSDPGSDGTTIRIDSSVTDSLGLRAVAARLGTLSRPVEASGVLGYDERNVTVLQTRATAWVEAVTPLAPDDAVKKGDQLAVLLVPDWITAQEEYLALRRIGDQILSGAAWQRMRLAGMPPELMEKTRQSGKMQGTWAVRSPVDGVVRELSLREGMTLPAGSTMVVINGTDRVWLEVALPEAQADGVQAGDAIEMALPSLPGEVIEARVTQVLPEADAAARVVRVRAEMDSREGRLRPGMTARVRLETGDKEERLLLPADAVIRSGRRDLVMLIEEPGLYRPVEIRTGREAGDLIEVLQGLEEGQRVVGSAQFLLDSEASLRGVLARALDAPVDEEPLHTADATLVYQDEEGLMLEHGPFESLGMAGMTMQFTVAEGVDTQHIEEGDRVRVWVRQDPNGLPIVRIEKLEQQP